MATRNELTINHCLLNDYKCIIYHIILLFKNILLKFIVSYLTYHIQVYSSIPAQPFN